MPATKVEMHQPRSGAWLPLKRTNDGFWVFGNGAFEKPVQMPFKIRLHSPTGKTVEDEIGRMGKHKFYFFH